MIAVMANSRTPLKIYLPAGSSLLSALQSAHWVQFEPLKSAEPPMSSGKLGAKAFKQFKEALRVAIFFAFWLKVCANCSASCCQPSGNLPSMRS